MGVGGRGLRRFIHFVFFFFFDRTAEVGMATGTYPSGITIPYPYSSKKISTRRVTHIYSRV
jgi:hypothetical protein